MPPNLLAQIPLIALAAVIVALVLVGGLQLGISVSIIANVILAAIAGGLAWLLFNLNQQFIKAGHSAKQTRLTADRLQSMLNVYPGGYAIFSVQGLLREVARAADILGIEKIAHGDDVIAALKDATPFVEAFRNLQHRGTDFTISVLRNKDDKSVQIAGRRFRIGRDGPLIDVLWFHLDSMPAVDTTSPAQHVQTLIDALPFPVWARSAALGLTMCNNAYATALETTRENVIKAQSELTTQAARGGSGRALAESALSSQQMQSGRRHVIVSGQRHLFAITEIPFAFGNDVALLGFATDVTAEEEKDADLQRHIEAEHQVLENLGTAIVIYGPDTRVMFYNRAYQRLWGAEEKFLDSKPTFGEILEDLRARRRAPEQADFQRYKKDRVSLFTSLLEPREDLMHLPDGTTLRILAAPHPLGGLMFVHEDVTDKLALESSYNTLIAVQQETLDNLAEGIAVFGPDGKLRLFNPAFTRIWKLAPDYLVQSPHIAELLEHLKPLFSFGNNWAEFKNEIVEYTLDRNPRRGRIERADHAIIEFISVPLPDGAVLNSYLDVTDSVKVEQALRASNAALATADRLKSEFVANVSYQLRTPLNTIMGFAEILTNQYFGTLNERQTEYTRTIMEASKKLLLLINDVLDLATIEAGRMTLEYRPINVADLLNAVKMMSVEWARQQSLDMTINCPSDIGVFDADEQRVKQVLFNLVSNAVKYTPAGGRVTLVAERRGEWMTLSVMHGKAVWGLGSASRKVSWNCTAAVLKSKVKSARAQT